MSDKRKNPNPKNKHVHKTDLFTMEKVGFILL